MADLAAELELPLVIVARPALGTLNHTALTIEAARTRGLVVHGVVISGMPSQPSVAEETNPHEIEALSDVRVVGVVPELDPIAVDDASDWLAPLLALL